MRISDWSSDVCSSDLGLYVPERIPRIALDRPLPTLADTAQAVLAPYFAASSLRGRLADVCRQAFSFDAPLRPLAGDGDYLLELFTEIGRGSCRARVGQYVKV